MNIEILGIPTDGQTTVTVRFEQDNIIHERSVNAVFDDGVYNEEMTMARCEEVGRGVAHKIAMGAITPQSETPTAPEPTPIEEVVEEETPEEEALAEDADTE
jgi:hypothetical protein